MSSRSGSIVTEGNSLTYGTGGTLPANAWPVVAATALSLGGGVVWTNVATSGATTQLCISRAATTNAYLTNATKVIVFWETRNDIRASGAAGDMAALRTLGYCATAKATTGANIICVSTIPSDAVEPPYASAAGEVQSLAANALIVANAAAYGIDAYVNLRANAAFANVAACSNAAIYNADKIHLTDAGYALVATLIAPAIAQFF